MLLLVINFRDSLYQETTGSDLSIALAGSVRYRLDIRIPQSKALQEAVLKILLTPNVTNLWTIEPSQYVAIFALHNILICQNNVLNCMALRRIKNFFFLYENIRQLTLL